MNAPEKDRCQLAHAVDTAWDCCHLAHEVNPELDRCQLAHLVMQCQLKGQ